MPSSCSHHSFVVSKDPERSLSVVQHIHTQGSDKFVAHPIAFSGNFFIACSNALKSRYRSLLVQGIQYFLFQLMNLDLVEGRRQIKYCFPWRSVKSHEKSPVLSSFPFYALLFLLQRENNSKSTGATLLKEVGPS